MTTAKQWQTCNTISFQWICSKSKWNFHSGFFSMTSLWPINSGWWDWLLQQEFYHHLKVSNNKKQQANKTRFLYRPIAYDGNWNRNGCTTRAKEQGNYKTIDWSCGCMADQWYNVRVLRSNDNKRRSNDFEWKSETSFASSFAPQWANTRQCTEAVAAILLFYKRAAFRAAIGIHLSVASALEWIHSGKESSRACLTSVNQLNSQKCPKKSPYN